MISPSYNSYAKEQYETLMMVVNCLEKLHSSFSDELRNKISNYLAFRAEVDDFHSRHFSDICTSKCYTSNLSACCSKDGIITFFADVVINVIMSDPADIDVLNAALEKPDNGFKCVYLGEKGCIWRIKPVVCEMFLCDTAKKQVLHGCPTLTSKWDALKGKQKTFTWPDKPVLFDEIESRFISAGCHSPLMYLHYSPGLLRVKKMGKWSK
jgi:hypothetical protein